MSRTAKPVCAPAARLTAYVEQQLPDVAEAGAVLQRMIERHGRSDRVFDLNALPKAIRARLQRRQAPSLYNLYYEIPESWLADIGVELPARFGVPVSHDG